MRCDEGGEGLGSFFKFISEINQNNFGKNIDGAANRVLLRPSQDGAPAKAEDVTDQGETNRFSSTVFLEIFRKSVDEG